MNKKRSNDKALIAAFERAKATSNKVIEVNAAPGLRMHLAPALGKPRNVAEPILEMLFPKGAPP